jgi:dienelactone hydrolase
MRSIAVLLVLAGAATAQAAVRVVDIAAPDGTTLKGTYYAAERPGPAVLLLHMCATTHASWAPVAERLAASGVSALTVDNRGFGESGGPRFAGADPRAQRQLRQKWPEDFDAVFAWLVAQPGVDRDRIGAGGASCGADNAVRLASRHREVRSLVLLAGTTDAAGLNYLVSNPWLPIFTAAASDDKYDHEFPRTMRWLAEVAGNPRNRSVAFDTGGHGTEIFGPHPELVDQIVSWFGETLVTSPADRSQKVDRHAGAAARFWTLASTPGSASKAAALFRDARTRDSNALVWPEPMLNQLAYTRLQAGGADDAIELLKLNTEAYPASANAYDSLADGYLARGDTDLALAAEQKCLELLPKDTTLDEQFKAQLKQVAEEKIEKLKGAGR